MADTKATVVRRRQVEAWWNLHPYMDHSVGSPGTENDVVLRVYAPGASVAPEMQVKIVSRTTDGEGNRVDVVERKWPHTAVPVELIDPDRMHEALVRVQQDLKLAKQIYEDQRKPRQSIFQMGPHLAARS